MKKNIALFFTSLFLVFSVFEILLRLYSVEFRIYLSDFGRKLKVHSSHAYFVDQARNAGANENTFNIYFIGESTMWGVPYGPELSIPNVVERRLSGTLQGKRVRIINFASAAKDSTYVRYVFDMLVKEKDTFHPSLIVSYSGHNDFLKFHPSDPDFHSPVLQFLAHHSEIARQLLTLICRSNGEILEIDQRQFFDRGIFPFSHNGYQKAVSHYRKNFLYMAEEAEVSGVPLILSTLVCNYSTWEPNRSVFCSSNKKEQKQFFEIFQQGLNAEKEKNYTSALKAYQQDLSICSRFAEVYFRLGTVYEVLEDYDMAEVEFQKAIDFDGMPVRALSAQNDFLRSLDHLENVYVVDSVAYLKKFTAHGLLNNNFIIDGIHPNLEGYLLVGEAISMKIQSLFATGSEKLKPLKTSDAEHIFQLNSDKLFEVAYSTGRWISRLATWRYDGTKRLEEAETFFHQAVALNPSRFEGYLGLAVISLMKTDQKATDEFLQKAKNIDVKSIDDYFQKPWIRKLVRRGSKNSIALPVIP